MNTLFDISVDEFFYPDKLGGESERRKRIDRMLNDMDEKELIIIEGGAESKKFSRLFGTWKIFAALDSQLLLCDRPGPWPGLLIPFVSAVRSVTHSLDRSSSARTIIVLRSHAYP